MADQRKKLPHGFWMLWGSFSSVQSLRLEEKELRVKS